MNLHPRLMLRGLKHSAERILITTGSAALARRLRSSSTLVLAYHNIVPEGEVGGGDRSLHLSQRRFVQQLETLARTHDVVPLASILQESSPPPSRPRAVITFDDGYAGAVSAGVTELRRFGLPATFFVTPGRLGRHAFWWDRLGRDGEVAPDLRHHALTVLQGKDEAICHWAGARALPASEVPESARSATEAELEVALRSPGVSVAAHTWSHPNLASLDSAELQMELARPLEWLRQRWPEALAALSFPYGLTSDQVGTATQRTRYEAAFLVTGGWLPATRNGEFQLPRMNVAAGLSPAGFELMTSGLVRR